jgi:ribosomal protein L30
MAKLRITYTKSAIGYSKDQKDTIRSLGLRKLNSIALHDDTPSIRGMAFKVRHLVRVEEVAEEPVAKPAKAPAAKPAKATLAPAAVAEQPAKAAKPAKADDLEQIEGIGPKIAAVLNAAGIVTFADLAAADTDRLAEILQQESNLRLADPSTWPEQAALAAAGKWDEFQALAEQLKGGRRA